MSYSDWLKNTNKTKDIVPLVTAVFISYVLLMIFILHTYTDYLVGLEQVIIEQAKEGHKMELNSELMELARSRTRLTSKVIDMNDIFEQDEANILLDEYASRFSRIRSEFLSLMQSEFEKEIIDKQNEIVKIILPAQRKTVELAMNAENKKAHNLLYEIVLPGQDKMIDSFAEMIVYEQKKIDDLSTQAQLSIKNINKSIYSIIALSLLFIIIISTIVIIKIKKIQNELIESHNDLEEKIDNRTHELNKAMKAAKQSAMAKSQFLATMSHEIRTPMNGVLGMTQLLESTRLEKTQSEYVQAIKNSGQLLLTVINDVLDFSKLDSNKVNLENIDLDFKCLCQDVIKLLKVNSDKKGLDLELNYLDDVPKFVSGDPSRLRQILFNLLGNAIKFTEHGYVRLSVTNKNENKSHVTLHIEIKDSGIGIKDENKNNMFQSFTQADNSTTRKFGGTGLGLVICKQLIRLMNGTIDFKSDYGKGSKFYIDIKFPKGHVIEITERDKNREISNNQYTGNILIVEDVTVNQIIAKSMLESMGLNCDLASDGKMAVEKCLHNKYDLVFMDCRMPNMDGYEATKIIRKQQKDSDYHLPIIALTANVTEDDRIKCIESGMDEILHKPFQANELEGALSHWLD